MEDKRKLELYEKALDWITENSTSRADLYDTLSEGLGMSDEEIIDDDVEEDKNLGGNES